MSEQRFIRPTTDFWQRIVTRSELSYSTTPPFRWGFPVELPDGNWLELPIRQMANDPDRAVASLIPNQASFSVARALAGFISELARPLGAEAVVGPPTLGMAFSPLVAEALGFDRYVPLGYSRKFWYRDDLTQDVRSLTAPGDGKKIYLDPNQVALVAGRRVVIVDDTVSNGTTLASVLALMAAAQATVVGVVVAMRQGDGWRAVAQRAGCPVRGVGVPPTRVWVGVGGDRAPP
jgi:adenine/guanine phosphoribosyltransferase-like PRPP-binding protein